jgi:membrane-bound lytic murein transglycosylase D
VEVIIQKLRLFFILGAFCCFFAQSVIAQPMVSDENLNVDSSSVELFEQDHPLLIHSDSTFAQIFSADYSGFDAYSLYDFHEDSVPSYMDSTYRERIAALNVQSPFDFQYNADIRKMIWFYSERRPYSISKALSAADLYFPLFEQMLDKYNIPMELKYLAIVESALNPKAISRAGAGGLWQFMKSTGRMYGLHVNSYVDDRMNPYKATEAAAQHLSDLYAIYHDWNLVLAAYNAGPGNVNRAIRRADSITDYWVIRQYLPRETQNYVPAFMAVCYVMNYADHHNIQELRPYPNYFNTDTVTIYSKATFKNLASWLDVDEALISQLNPQYKRGFIPKSTNGHVLCLPMDKVGYFILNEEKILSGKSRRQYELQALAD